MQKGCLLSIIISFPSSQWAYLKWHSSFTINANQSSYLSRLQHLLKLQRQNKAINLISSLVFWRWQLIYQKLKTLRVCHSKEKSSGLDYHKRHWWITSALINRSLLLKPSLRLIWCILHKEGICSLRLLSLRWINERSSLQLKHWMVHRKIASNNFKYLVLNICL